MDERLRELERRAAAGDREAGDALSAARRRVALSPGAEAVLAAHRRVTGGEHDAAELTHAQANEVIAALYEALGWLKDPRTGAFTSPDGQRRVTWTPQRRMLQREKGGRGKWTRDLALDPAGKNDPRELAARFLEAAAKDGRLREEAIDCAPCAGRGWTIDAPDPEGWGALRRCPACAVHPGDEAAGEQALADDQAERCERGWRDLAWAKSYPGRPAELAAMAARFRAWLATGEPADLFAPGTTLRCQGTRWTGAAALPYPHEQPRQPAALRGPELDGLKLSDEQGSSHLGEVAFYVRLVDRNPRIVGGIWLRLRGRRFTGGLVSLDRLAGE